MNLAFISAFAGDSAAGEEEERTALEMNPSATQGYLVLAEAQLGQGQLEKAAESYRRLETFGPQGVSTAAPGLADPAIQIQFLAAIAYVDAGDLAKAQMDSGYSYCETAVVIME
jgi:predicted TPR repeat methyltransferase